MTQTSNQNHENRKTPPVSVKEAGGSDNTAMGSRFRELLGILRRHDLVRGLTPEKLRHAKRDMCILHPLPRVNEIAYDVDDNPKAYYFQQAQNGLYAREAILCDVLGITLEDVKNDILL